MMLSSLVKFPLVFISGIFIPLQQMPPWGLALAVCSPLTYFTDLARYSFTGANYFPILGDFAALGVFTVVFTAGTMYLHKRTMPKRM
jgi:ABC-2 type transport system permease protein